LCLYDAIQHCRPITSNNGFVVAKLGAAAASILLQNLELQGFFREAERKKEIESEKDNENER
jgi:hypothetical protein